MRQIRILQRVQKVKTPKLESTNVQFLVIVVSTHYMQRKLKIQSVSFLGNTLALETFMTFLDFSNVSTVRDYGTNLLILHTFNLS